MKTMFLKRSPMFLQSKYMRTECLFFSKTEGNIHVDLAPGKCAMKV